MLTSFIASLTRLITGVRTIQAPLEREKQYVFFSNHASHLDFVVIWSVLPPSIRHNTVPVAAKDYWSKGRLKPWIAKNVFHSVLLNRSGRGKSRQHPLQAIYDTLEDGKSIILFPEGTRSSDGEMKPFKAGIYSIAEKYPHCELVPIALDNLTRILPKGEILPLPLIGRTHFLEPTKLLQNESKQDFLTRLYALINQELTPTDE